MFPTRTHSRIASLSSVSVAVMAAACAPGDGLDSDDYGDDVLPTEEQVRVNLPVDDASSKSPEDPDDWAMFYVATRNVTENVNGLIAHVLGTVYRVTHAVRPTRADWDTKTAVWGPFSDSGLDPVETGIMVRREDDGSTSWVVFQVPAGGDVETESVAIAGGTVDAGSTRRAASGEFGLDFDTANSMDPAVDQVGRFYVEYAYDSDGVSAVAGMDDFGDEDGELHDAVYAYDEDTAGAGEMDLAWLEDLDDPGDAEELHALKARWTEDGLGRGDVFVTAGDMGEERVTASECWGESFTTVYWTDTGGLYDEIGSESECAFTPAEYATRGEFSLSE